MLGILAKMSCAVSPLPITRKLTEETANRLTHGFGLILSLAGVPFLLLAARTRGTVAEQIGCAAFGAALIALYAASTLSHTFQRHRLRQLFRIIDQVCIFLLLAGTFTPFALSCFREGWQWAFAIGLWGLTLGAITYKVFVLRSRNMAVWVYVVLGWSPAIILSSLATQLDGSGVAWILAGGLAYTVGTIFLLNDRKVCYFHAVWHTFVVVGSACHFVAVMYFLLPEA